MNETVKHFAIAGPVGAGLSVTTLWWPEGLVRVVGAVCVVVIVLGGLWYAARRAGLVDVGGDGDAPQAEEAQVAE